MGKICPRVFKKRHFEKFFFLGNCGLEFEKAF
jgi:hypothetical protein